MANMVMGSPHSAAIYWGEENVAIYNEAYISIAGNKHPALMGQSYKVAWAEIWEDQIECVFKKVRESGQAIMKDNDRLFIERNGFLEETYFNWSICPLIGENGQVSGLYNPAFESTKREVAERRMLTLREVGLKVAMAKDVRSFWEQICEGLDYNEYDVPYLYVYSVTNESKSDSDSMNSGSLASDPQVVLEGTRGVPENHPSRSNPVSLRTSNQGWVPYLRQADEKRTLLLLPMDDTTGLSEMVVGLENRGFGDSCRSTVVCPIYSTIGGGSSVLGFLVIGINPRRPYDDDYSLFIQLLSRQIATSLASVVLLEEQIRRKDETARLAALDRIRLSKQLDLRTQEVCESENKFKRIAELVPVGIFIANPQGHIIYSNDTWLRLLGNSDNWLEAIIDVDRHKVNTIWTKAIKDKRGFTDEFRVKTPWQDQNGNQGDTWILMSAYPEKDSEGDLKSVFGSVTDISSQKWAESYQRRRMEEAIDMKRQQEIFIDMTSHEIRNPMSVILQCADEINLTLSEHCDTNDLSQQTIDILDSTIDAANTITLCSLHQKRIVDDILTLSKLESALLLITPVDVQPIVAIQGALNMFKGELQSYGIALEFQIQDSFMELAIDWVKLDPSRLLQVLINLITNAIKFTRSQETRTIIVTIGASIPSLSKSVMPSVSYFPSRSKREDITQGKDWGTGKEIFLYFTVQDTGQGLNEEEKNLLFNRFSQASPLTHVQYGGSGLGLFISRELTELQGGEIGVASEHGVGSTFAFYIKSRQTNTPAKADSISSMRLGKNLAGNTVVSFVDSKKKNTYMYTNVKEDQPVAFTEKVSLESFKVLIVEDNLVNQKVLQKQLRNLHCVTHVANHGGEALKILKGSKFWKGNEQTGFELTIVLMDLEMPVMDGITCAKRIRDLEADGTIVKHVPIIAVTANARAEQIDMALNAGIVS
jgi:PAS domain S-box-containing protein